MSKPFEVISGYKPEGDQPQAIDKLTAGVLGGKKFQTLMGVTGSGKTFTMAHTIERLKKPTLVISHNKTLAAQLYEEFKELFPHNAVGYFVSYYDYYQPEAYIPQRDIYIEKDASRNDDLDRLRLAATSNLVSRDDVLLVASVSCIFGLGSPVNYKKSVLPIRTGVPTDRDDMLRALIDLQYSRNDIDFKRATFRVRGRSEEHTSELQSRLHLVCRLPLEKNNRAGPDGSGRRDAPRPLRPRPRPARAGPRPLALRPARGGRADAGGDDRFRGVRSRRARRR